MLTGCKRHTAFLNKAPSHAVCDRNKTFIVSNFDQSRSGSWGNFIFAPRNGSGFLQKNSATILSSGHYLSPAMVAANIEYLKSISCMMCIAMWRVLSFV
jgi:hypothetical protein